jgi:predicted N-acyltransferase
MGAIGAVNPSIITMKAIPKEEVHPRLRGLTLGVIEAMPGGNVLQSFIYRGSELDIKKGDELLVQAHSPYKDQATTTQVSAKFFAGDAGDGQNAGKHYYPKYQAKFTPKSGNKVLGTHTDSEDRFGLWQ